MKNIAYPASPWKPSDAEQVSQALRPIQIQQLYASAPIAYGGTVIVTIATALILWGKILPRFALLWVGITVLVAACRLLLSWHYARCPEHDKGDARWLRWFQMSATAAGVAWGLGAVLMFVGDSVAHQMLLLLLLLGMMTAAVYSYSIHMPTFISFAAPILLGSLYSQWSLGDPQWNDYLMFTSLIFTLSAVWFAKLLSRSVTHAMTLQQQNKAMAEALREKSLQSERANLAKSRFLAAASHDLRQPVHALGLFLASLARGNLPASALGTIAEMEACVAATNDLFSSILDISRLDAGIIQPDCQPLAIAPFSRRIVTEHQVTAHAKGLSFRFYLSPRLEQAHVMTDEKLLERILRNLLLNAIRYTRQGGVLLALRPRGEGILIEVWDTGTGIAAEQLDEIYQEFVQLQPHHQEHRQGLGLGLSIVKRLCALLGHPIAVHSRLERGSCFRLGLPQSPAAAQPPLQAAAHDGQPFLQDKFILVLDDDPVIVRALSGLLASWGARVHGDSNVDDLLAASTGFDRCPDLVISDLHLQGPLGQRAGSGLDGIAAVARLRDEFAHNIPAMLVTGESDPAPLRQAQSAGMLVLHKPLKSEVLMTHLCLLFGTMQQPQLAQD